jgi:hypothetical protein
VSPPSATRRTDPEPRPPGFGVLALWPVLAFGLGKSHPPRPSHPNSQPRSADTRTDHTRTGQDRSGPVTGRSRPDRAVRRRGHGRSGDPARAGRPRHGGTRIVADDLARQGRPLTRTALAHGVSTRGRHCSTLLPAAVRQTNDNADRNPDRSDRSACADDPGQRRPARHPSPRIPIGTRRDYP